MPSAAINHYATLGLSRRCTDEQILAAYRVLAKRYHPDLNLGSPETLTRSQEVNEAYEILSDSARRSAYDRELDASKKAAAPARRGKVERHISQDMQLRVEDFIRGVSLEVRVNDPANSEGPEIYPLVIPPETAPGARFRVPRTGSFAGGFVQVRLRALPGFRFKVRGSDLRCDLRINSRRAAEGGQERIPGATGALLAVVIPRGVGRGEILRLPGEGLPKPRGGRGDLLVRITYRPEVRIVRSKGIV